MEGQHRLHSCTDRCRSVGEQLPSNSICPWEARRYQDDLEDGEERLTVGTCGEHFQCPDSDTDEEKPDEKLATLAEHAFGY